MTIRKYRLSTALFVLLHLVIALIMLRLVTVIKVYFHWSFALVVAICALISFVTSRRLSRRQKDVAYLEKNEVTQVKKLGGTLFLNDEYQTKFVTKIYVSPVDFEFCDMLHGILYLNKDKVK